MSDSEPSPIPHPTPAPTEPPFTVVPGPAPLPPVPVRGPVVEAPAAGPPAAEPAPGFEAEGVRDLGPDTSRPVVAFFYPWYAETAWTQPPMSDLPPDHYLSDDESVMRMQVLQAKLADINAFVSSWAGIGSDTDKNFARLLDRCPDGFFACPYFETALIKGDKRDLTSELQQLSARYMSHPRFFRFQDRPVVFFWAPKAIGAPPGKTSVQAWRAVRAAVDPHSAQLWNVETKDPEPWFEVFDAFHLFSAADWAAPTAADFDPLLRANVIFRQRTDGYNRRHNTTRLFTAGVRPGYDDVAIRAKQRLTDPTVPVGYVRPREDGAYYLTSGRAAAMSQPDMLGIVSYNEWFEGSQIEPSVTYGNRYLNLTNDIVAEYRAIQGPLPALTFPPGVRYFPETGHILQRGFLSYWDDPVASRRLGPPVTDEMAQTIDGASYIVQYFMNGYRLQWNTSAKAAVQLVTLSADDWSREPD